MVGVIPELPDRAPVPLSLPVDDPALGGTVEEDREAASAGIERLGELPSDLEQIGDELVAFVAAESVRIAATTDRPDEQGFHVVDVVK